VISGSGLLSVTLTFVGAALLVAAIVVGAGLLFHADSLWRGRISAWIVPILAFGSAISTLYSGRDLTKAYLDFDFSARGMDPIGANILRGLTVIAIGLAVAQIVGRRFSQTDREPVRNGQWIWIAFLIYFLTNSIVNAAFGTKPTFDNALLYPLLIVGALYVARATPAETLARAAMGGFLSLLVASLVLAVAVPDLAVQSNYSGWVPGLDGRLWGIGSNPNSIGPIALSYLMLAYAFPWKRRWASWLGALVALSVLVLAQSKTTWLGAVIVVGVVMWYRVKTPDGRLRPGMLVTMLVAVVLVCVAILLVDPGSALGSLAGGNASAELSTFSGRVGIWNVAIEHWRANPLFGYGLTIWDGNFRRQIGMPFAFSAHNQFLQSLSAAGLVGLAGLAVYVIALVTASHRQAASSKGITMALCTFMLIRFMTETPLDITGIFSDDFMCHLVLLQLLFGRKAEVASAAAVQFRPSAAHLMNARARPQPPVRRT